MHRAGERPLRVVPPLQREKGGAPPVRVQSQEQREVFLIRRLVGLRHLWRRQLQHMPLKIWGDGIVE